MPEISIVIPVFNGEKYISMAIQSILDQEFKNWELIIVNDCSTDNTLKIIEEYSNNDSRIKCFSNVQNLKLPQTLNEGFSRATGKYYTWSSDDNLYKPQALSVMYEYLERHNETGMVYCNYTVINDDGKIIQENKLLDPKFLPTGNTVGACFLYRSSVAAKVGKYNPELFLVEDYDYWYRIFQISSIVHLNDNLYYYRMHKNSLTATKQKEIKKKQAQLQMKYIKFATKQIEDQAILFALFCDILECNPEDERKNRKILYQLVPIFYWYDMKHRIGKRLKWVNGKTNKGDTP